MQIPWVPAVYSRGLIIEQRGDDLIRGLAVTDTPRFRDRSSSGRKCWLFVRQSAVVDGSIGIEHRPAHLDTLDSSWECAQRR